MLESKKMLNDDIQVCIITNDAHDKGAKADEVCLNFFKKMGYSDRFLVRRDRYPIKFTDVLRFRENESRKDALFCLITLDDLISSSGVLKANNFTYFYITRECYSLLENKHIEFLKDIYKEMKVENKGEVL